MGERGKPEWVVEMEGKLSGMKLLPTEEELPEERKHWRRLYGIPDSVRNKPEREIYNPQRVLLGPLLFHGKKGVSLDDLNWDVKEASVLHFVRRSGKPLESYITALREVIEELEYAFFGLDIQSQIEHRETNFLRLMLVGGSFLLEFIRTEKDRRSRSLAASDNPVIWSIVEDREEMKCYLHDILLLENQLPIMLLQRLLMVSEGANRIEDIEDFWIRFLKDIITTLMPINHVPRIEHMYSEFKSSLHILDVYRRSIIHRDFKSGKNPQRRKSHEEFFSMNIPSATELHKAGIGFTTSDSTSILDVSFPGNILMLPEIVLDDDSTRSLFLNLIAFEQLHKDVAKNEVASYMIFMGCLVQVADDASLLQSRGIIVTTMPPAEVAKWFNLMTKSISLDPDDPLAPEFMEMFTMLRARYNKMSNEWRKDLFQNYLKSPWAIMSIMAGFVLLVLTTIQTVYTVLSYVRPK